MMFRNTVLAAFVAVSFTSATVAETRQERLAVAQEYVAATMEELDMPAVIQQMWQPVVDQVEASGTVVSESARAKIDVLYQETFGAPMHELMLAQDEIMTDIMTIEEITALRDFYATDLGRSVMKKLPEMLAVQQPLIMAMVQDKLPIVLPEIQKIISGQ